MLDRQRAEEAMDRAAATAAKVFDVEVERPSPLMAVIGRHAVGWDGTRWVLTVPASDARGETYVADWSDDPVELVRSAVMRNAGDVFDDLLPAPGRLVAAR